MILKLNGSGMESLDIGKYAWLQRISVVHMSVLFNNNTVFRDGRISLYQTMFVEVSSGKVAYKLND